MRGAWVRASAGAGSKGERLYDWACLALSDADAEGGAGRWLLVRRNIDELSKLAYYLAYGPKETPVKELVRVAGKRWVIEDCFEAAKGEVGLDECEVRKWDGWYRHATLSLLAHAYLAVLSSAAEQEENGAKGEDLISHSCLELIPPTVAEVRCLVLAMTGPEDEREFRLGWSLWRRAHQAVARRCHRAARRAKRPTSQPQKVYLLGCATQKAAHGVPRAPLSAAEWERVRPLLLPPQKPCVGRPRRDQRVVVDAILWVLGTGASWRDVPRERFGLWETIYGRYGEWRKNGRWQRVLEALGFGDTSGLPQ